MSLLAWHNQIDSAVLTSDTTWVATLPLVDLQSYLLPKVARTTTDAEFTITATWASAVSIGCVFLANHNLSSAAKVRVKTYNGVTELDDSTDLAVYPQLNNAIVANAVVATLRHDLSYWLPANVTADKVEITITDTSNANNYVQLGRIFTGEAYEPSGGVDYGDQPISYKDLSEITTTPRGIKYAYSQQKLRTVDLTLKYLPETEIFNEIFNAQRILGLTGEVVYSQLGRPTYTTVSSKKAQSTPFYASCFIANFAELNPLNQQFYQGYQTALKLEEVAV